MASSAPLCHFSLLLLIFNLLLGLNSAHLSMNFYSKTCPHALSIIKTTVYNAVKLQPRMGASLLRFHFHDCFVNGCDASILLEDTATFIGEQTAAPNNNTLRGLNVVDDIKTQLEESCAGVVSCADILTVAARDSVVVLGGPTWNVLLGRRDSTTASKDDANTNLPAPDSSLDKLISSFAIKGFTARQMVALSGGHTIGKAGCATFRNRLYNDSIIDPSYAKWLQSICPQSGDDRSLAPLDITSPTSFDNSYFKNLQCKKGLLYSDQQLFSGGLTDSIVEKYVSHPAKFAKDFAKAMVKMSKLSPLTRTNGEIRKDCKKINYY
ncbi:PREDICTED: cationic peroxidase 1-like [Ipomoea nil]|uniref:cationic peroxidase 1-like n=1 Tax=Ipomoea nil TaxID=35883 RepID=UPI000901C3D6|nr:PREDICTED: cationic peroxidase 1-like [Ipomoea nil]